MENSRRSEAIAMVRSIGPIDPTIARAMERVPRHRFVPLAHQPEAYEDAPIPLPGGEATISAPHMVAIQLQRAEIRPGDAVLEIGSGSGYLLALIAELAGASARVLGIEVDPALVTSSIAVLGELGYLGRVRVVVGDGLEGAADAGPFDEILVSFAIREIVPAWREALREGGRLVAPVGGHISQRLLTVDRNGRVIASGPDCRFVPAQRPRHPIYRPAN